MRFSDRTWKNVRAAEGRRSARRARRRRSMIEGLEDRALMTTLFTPLNGAETVHDYGGPKLSSSSPGTPIYLIFWGSYWSTTAGQAQAAADENAIDPVLYNSSLLDGLQEYGTSNRAFFPTGTWAVFDYSNSGSTVSDAAIKSEVDYGISSLGLPDSDTYSNTGIYYVITAPGVTSSTYTTAGGYHSPEVTNVGGDPDTRYYGWLRNYSGTPSSQIDWFSYVLSHETMESFSDPAVNVNSGIIVTTINGEICDAEAQNYTAVLNGYQVQSFWSAAHQAYEISDGNSQTVTVNNGNLVVNGDQFGANYNDVVTVDLNSRGGVQVGLNGQIFSFMPGAINHVTVNTFGGSNATYIYNTSASAPVTVYDGGTTDNDYIGNGSNGVQGINGAIDLHNPSYYSNITIDDSANYFSSRSATLTNGYVSGLAPAPIYYNQGDLNSLYIKTGGAGDTISVNSTATNGVRFPYTQIDDTGGGSNTVNVYGTSGPIYLNGLNGFQNVYVGLGSTAAIGGFVDVYNGTSGYSYLSVDNSSSAAVQTVNMYNGRITGIAPATIYYNPNAVGSFYGGVNYLNVKGSNGGATYNVHDASNFYNYTDLNTGTGNDAVNVLGTTGSLYVVNTGGHDSTTVGSSGSMTGINGLVNVSGFAGSGDTYLYLDDSADAVGRAVDMYNGQITGIAPAPIYWAPTPTSSGGVTYLNVRGGTGGNTFNVHDTSNFYLYTDLSTGTGNDAVNVLATTGGLYDYNNGGHDNTTIGSAGSMTAINGLVDVYGAGDTYLYLDDSADATGGTVDMLNGQITGIAPATIYWAPTPTSSGGVTYLNVRGGTGGNTFNVHDTSNFYLYTDLSTGTGNDAVNVLATTGGLYVNNTGGNDTAVVGSNAPTTSGGVLSAVNGLIDVYGSGSIALTVDDSSDSAVRTAILTSSALNGLAPATIDYGSNVTSLTINGGSAANTYNVQGTLAGAATTLNTGAGDDAINVENAAAMLDDIQGALTVNGQGGIDTLVVNDSGQTTGMAYTLTGSTLTRTGMAGVTFGGVSSLILDLGSGNDTVTASAIPAFPATVNGGGGSDTLVGPNATSTWNITGSNAGNLGNLTFTAVQNLTGGTGDDTFRFGNGAGVSGIVNGGGGTDKLDYSAYTPPSPSTSPPARPLARAGSPTSCRSPAAPGPTP